MRRSSVSSMPCPLATLRGRTCRRKPRNVSEGLLVRVHCWACGFVGFVVQVYRQLNRDNPRRLKQRHRQALSKANDTIQQLQETLSSEREARSMQEKDASAKIQELTEKIATWERKHAAALEDLKQLLAHFIAGFCFCDV